MAQTKYIDSLNLLPKKQMLSQQRFTQKKDCFFDTETNLEWALANSTNSLNWKDAMLYCTSLGEGWKLPTDSELHSIIDRSIMEPCTSLPGMLCSGYWSSTSYPDIPNGGAWRMEFYLGYVGGYNKDALFNVRAVRNKNKSNVIELKKSIDDSTTILKVHDQPNKRFILKKDCYLDIETKLEWSLHNSDKIRWNCTEEFCINIGEEWRLPTRKELRSIIDTNLPTSFTELDNIISTQYWTSDSSNGSYIWMVNFHNGKIETCQYHLERYCRAVRN